MQNLQLADGGKRFIAFLIDAIILSVVYLIVVGILGTIGGIGAATAISDGGEISDSVISNINFNARIVLCGQIALYNSTEIPMGPRLQPLLLTRSVLMQGFIIGNYQNQFSEGIGQLSDWIKDGKLKYKETIVKGFDKLPAALLGLFEGDNIGKMIVEA